VTNNHPILRPCKGVISSDTNLNLRHQSSIHPAAWTPGGGAVLMYLLGSGFRNSL
jgi:hypothetical protein